MFNKGKIPLLIGTDVIGRGIDFPNVKYIINYDAPKTLDDYIHRIGRTGRCGNTGEAITFFSKNDNIAFGKDLIRFLQKNKIEPPKFMVDICYGGKSSSFSGGGKFSNSNGFSKGGGGYGYHSNSSNGFNNGFKSFNNNEGNKEYGFSSGFGNSKNSNFNNNYNFQDKFEDKKFTKNNNGFNNYNEKNNSFSRKNQGFSNSNHNSFNKNNYHSNNYNNNGFGNQKGFSSYKQN